MVGQFDHDRVFSGADVVRPLAYAADGRQYGCQIILVTNLGVLRLWSFAAYVFKI